MSRLKKILRIIWLPLVVLLTPVYFFRFAWSCHHNEDGCHVIALELVQWVKSGEPVSNALVEEHIAHVIRASVIRGRFDAEGRPTDMNGNRYIVEWTDKKVTVSTKPAFFDPLGHRREVMR